MMSTVSSVCDTAVMCRDVSWCLSAYMLAVIKLKTDMRYDNEMQIVH